MTPLRKRPLYLMLPLAILFLFETWIWGGMLAATRYLVALVPWERFKAWAKSLIDKAPAIVAVLLFGVPLAAMEFGSFISVVLMALGHVIVGALLYALMKIIGVSLVAVIFDLTRDRLMRLGWFVFVYGHFHRFHEFASELVKPYRLAAIDGFRALTEQARAALSRLWATVRGGATG